MSGKNVIKLDLGVKNLLALIDGDEELQAQIRTHVASTVGAELSQRMVFNRMNDNELRRQLSEMVEQAVTDQVGKSSSGFKPEVVDKLRASAGALVCEVIETELDVLNIQSMIREVFDAEMDKFKSLITEYAETYAQQHFREIAKKEAQNAFAGVMKSMGND